jgi:uncharacterized protein
MLKWLIGARWPAAGIAAVLLFAGAEIGAAQPQGHGCCGVTRGGMMQDADHRGDMQLFRVLLDNRGQIRREITMRVNGVDTLTESDNPAVASALQAHVESMSARVKEARPIHQRDPLFREVFKHADQIVIEHELTPKGVKVTETSSDPYVVKLIQAHAEVVSAFIANGYSEMMKNHAVPEVGR